jgi:hypothetical protein
MSKKEIIALQKGLNSFTRKYLRGLGPIHVDGVLGDSTRGRIRTIKYYLGYTIPKGEDSLSSDPDFNFRQRLYHPRNPKYSTPERIARGAARRRKQRRLNRPPKPKDSDGLSMYDGRVVVSWMVPWFQKIRARGRWRGTLVSGYRTPAYSESLCYAMCGRPSCQGRCAGRSTNHAKKGYLQGAADMSDYWTFAAEARAVGAPFHNSLPNDRVHFSHTGA